MPRAMPQEPSRLQTSPHRFCARARFTIPILHKSYRYLHRNETSFCFVSGCPTLDRAKNGVFSTLGPNGPITNDKMTRLQQCCRLSQTKNAATAISVHRWPPPGGCRGAPAGHYGPFTTLCIFQSLLNTPKNARWEVHHLSAAGSMLWFYPSQDIDAAQKAPPCAARRGQQQVKRPYAYGRRTTKLG